MEKWINKEFIQVLSWRFERTRLHIHIVIITIVVID